MRLPNIAGLVQVGKTFIMANRPELLLGASVTSTIGAVVLAAKGGYEARGKVADAEMERVMMGMSHGAVEELEKAVNDDANKLTTREKFDLTWLCYMPAAITCTGSLGSQAGLHIVHVKEKKALAAMALSAIEEVKTEAKRFQDELLSVTTAEEKKAIQDRLFEKNADPNTGVAAMQNTDGEIENFYLVRDAKTGRDIWSNRHRIEDALIEVNNVLVGSGDCELNHFYRHAGFQPIPEGSEMGWSGELVDISWSTTIRDDGRPVTVFEFRNKPRKGFGDARS